jgi:hypothetical protein
VRTVQTAILATTLALVAAGCGGSSPGGAVAHLGTTKAATTSPSTPAPASTGSPQAEAVALSGCMRSHGVPNFPDPVISTSGNSVRIAIHLGGAGGLDPNSSAFRSAQHDCRAFAPPGPSNPAPVSTRLQAQYLKAAACMRAHGVPIPDPTFSAQGVHLDASGIDERSPSFLKAYQTCLPLIPVQARLGS